MEWESSYISWRGVLLALVVVPIIFMPVVAGWIAQRRISQRRLRMIQEENEIIREANRRMRVGGPGPTQSHQHTTQSIDYPSIDPSLLTQSTLPPEWHSEWHAAGLLSSGYGSAERSGGREEVLEEGALDKSRRYVDDRTVKKEAVRKIAVKRIKT